MACGNTNMYSVLQNSSGNDNSKVIWTSKTSKLNTVFSTHSFLNVNYEFYVSLKVDKA